MVDFSTATGLFEGIRARLKDSDAALLEEAIAQLKVFWAGRQVDAPGIEIWKALCGETFDAHGFRDNYQVHFTKLITDLQAGTAASVRCCDYHRNLFVECARHLTDPVGSWLTSFLEVLAATGLELHFQYLSTIDLAEPTAANLKLSRFMRLDAFVRNHTTAPLNPTTLADFQERLSPKFSTTARNACLRTSELGMWHGRIGSYPGVVGAAEKYTIWCENIKPFATLTSEVDAFDRRGSPHRVLQRLGVPFGEGQHWIELIYFAKFAAFRHATDEVLRLAIPTQLESAGNWAFRPDRDPANDANHARDLQTGDRGLKEIVHERIDVSSLSDVIVWGMPTDFDWSEPASPFAVVTP